MENNDLLLSCLFARVKHYHEPEDNPVSLADLAKDSDLSVEDTLLLSQDLYKEGFVTISPLNIPPLVYISLTGIARARRLEGEYHTFARL